MVSQSARTRHNRATTQPCRQTKEAMRDKRIKQRQWEYLNDYLRKERITYQQYLQSDHWQDVRKRYWKSKLHDGSCWACGEKNKPLQLHHKTYKRIGKERLNDLILLCGMCHKDVHTLEKSGWRGILYGAARHIKKSLRAA